MADPIKAPITYPVIAGGKIVAGGSVVFGAANVKPDPENPATLKSIWLDNALTQQAQNPQGLDSNGVFDQSSTGLLYGEVADTYSVVVFDANGSELSYIPVYDLSDANAAITAQEAATEAQTAEAGAISARNLVESLYSDFLIRYFGTYASDPSTNDEGNPPEEGSLYWNSTIKAFRVYSQGSWVAAKDLAVVVPTVLPRLTGDGATTDYNLGFSSADTDSFLVYIDGVYQKPVDNFTVDFNTGDISFVTAPPNGSNIDITYFDPSTIANLNNSLVTATGTTTPRTLADSASDEINVKQFDDDVIAANEYCRANKKTLFIPAGTYNLPSELDISGSRIRGERFGFNDGTVLIFDRAYDGLVQKSNTSGDITYHLESLVVKEARWGFKMNYSVGSTIKNLSILDSDNGIQVGVYGTLGPLFNYFENLWVDVDNEGLSLGGDDFCNANQFNTCFIRGHSNAGRIDAGGLGALSNTFVNTEFRGDNLGVIFGSSKSTQFYGCYFECEAPAIKIAGFSQDIRLDSCVYGTLVNTNSEGINSFIWHESGAASAKVSGGYITLGKTDGTQDNLSFIHSDSPTFLKYESPLDLDTEILASGWSVYGAGLPTDRFSVKHQGSYTPTWTGQGGTQPALGDGTIEGFYTLNGNECTAYIELTIGSTTSMGSGAFLFSLPFSSIRERTGTVLHFESGIGFDSGVSKVNSGSNQVVCYPSNGNITSNISPWVWSAGDKISITLTHPIN